MTAFTHPTVWVKIRASSQMQATPSALLCWLRATDIRQPHRGAPLPVFMTCQSNAVRILLHLLGHSWGAISAQARKRSVAASQLSCPRSSSLKGAGS